MARRNEPLDAMPQPAVTRGSNFNSDGVIRFPTQYVIKHRELVGATFVRQSGAESKMGTCTHVHVLTKADELKTEDIMLHFAASEGIVDVVVPILAEEKTNCDVLDRCGRTALHWAAERGHLLVIQALLNAGANVEPQSRRKATPLMLAALSGHERVVCMLLEAGAGVSDRCSELPKIIQWRSTALHYAASGGHLGVVSTLLDAGFHKQQRNEAGLTAAEISARAHYAYSPAVTRVLLPRDRGARMVHEYVNMVMEDIDIVGGLVKCEAFLDWQDGIGNSPLHRAAHFRHVTISKILLRSGAEVDLRNRRGGSPLHVASCQGSVPIAAALLEAGAEKEARMVNGRSPLHLAVINDNIEVVRLLLRKGAFTEHRDRCRGQTPLSEAAEYGLAPVIRLLLDAGANLESTSLAGLTPLHWACRFTHLASVELLLASGADPDAVDQTAAKAAKMRNTTKNEKNTRANAFQPTSSDVVGLGDPCRWNEDARRPFSGELESVAKKRLDSVSRSQIMSVLQRTRKNRNWRRRGWLLVLVNRNKATGNADNRVKMTSRQRMQTSYVPDVSTTGNDDINVLHCKSCDGKPRLSNEWRGDETLCKKSRVAANHSQRADSSLKISTGVRSNNQLSRLGIEIISEGQHHLRLSNGKAGSTSSLLQAQGTIEALVGLASVELDVFCNVVRFI